MTGESRDRATDRAYRDHAGEVYRVAYAILRDRDEALDATHDAFARAWERWDQYDSKRPLQPWLHGIVVHVALDQLRRRRVRRLAVSLLGSAAVTDIGTGAGADPSVDVVRRHVVEDGLASLRPDARAALSCVTTTATRTRRSRRTSGRPAGPSGRCCPAPTLRCASACRQSRPRRPARRP